MSSSKRRWKDCRRSRRNSSRMSLAQYASTHSWKSRSGGSAARKKGGRPPCSSRCGRSSWPKSTRSASVIGVSQTSALRPVRVSRNRAEAPRVEEPVARMRVVGKWSAAILRSSDGFDKRCTSSKTTRLPRCWRRKPSGSSSSRRTLGSSQSKYSHAGRDWQRTLLPTRRTPMSQTTERRRQALSIRSSQAVRLTTPAVLHLVEPNATLATIGRGCSRRRTAPRPTWAWRWATLRRHELVAREDHPDPRARARRPADDHVRDAHDHVDRDECALEPGRPGLARRRSRRPGPGGVHRQERPGVFRGPG